MIVSNYKKKPRDYKLFFSVVTVNDEHRKPRFKMKRGIKFKENSDLKATGISKSQYFLKRLSREKVLNNNFLKSI